MTTWRKYYSPRIAALIKEYEGRPLKELKQILASANPGQYGHMRKIWANEYMRQLGLSKKKKLRMLLILIRLNYFELCH